MRSRQLLFPAEDEYATRPGESMELAMALAFRSEGWCRTQRRPAPESLVPTTAERASTFSGNRAYRWRAGAARERTKISVLSRFSGNSPAGERLLAPLNLMPARSKRKASREQIRSGAAFFLETSGDAPCEAHRIAKIARSRLKSCLPVPLHLVVPRRKRKGHARTNSRSRCDGCCFLRRSRYSYFMRRSRDSSLSAEVFESSLISTSIIE